MATKKKTPTIDQKWIDLGLEHLVPDPIVGETYVSRTVKGWKDFDYFDAASDLYHNILMEGPSGAGKTMAVRADASIKRRPLSIIEFSRIMDPMAAFGTTRVDEERRPIHVKSSFVHCFAEGGDCLLDEVSMTHPGFSAAFHGGLDGRGSLTIPQTGEVVKRHPDTRIFAAYNPKYRGVVQLNEAFLNRFAFPMVWGYDPDVEQQLVGDHSQTLLDTARKLRADENIISDIGTNFMEEFIHIAHRMDTEAAVYLFTNKFQESERMIVGTTMEAESWNIAGELGLNTDRATDSVVTEAGDSE